VLCGCPVRGQPGPGETGGASRPVRGRGARAPRRRVHTGERTQCEETQPDEGDDFFHHLAWAILLFHILRERERDGERE